VKDELRVVRELSRVLEPFVGCVYFAPEVHSNYVHLGFLPSPRNVGEVQMPDGFAYFTSRGSLLGQVHGNLVASAFAVFNPQVVIPAVTAGWAVTNAPIIRQARQSGAVEFLSRVLADDIGNANLVADALERGAFACNVAGRPLFAGVVAGTPPSNPIDRAWFFGDALREARGDGHTAAWTCKNLDPIEIGLLTELYWGLPSKSYVRTRGWSSDQLDAGLRRLAERGLVDDGTLTRSGLALREAIETDTDTQMVPALHAIGADMDVVIATLDRWSATVRANHGYPNSGPRDLAQAQK
jgi:hypothetical protein